MQLNQNPSAPPALSQEQKVASAFHALLQPGLGLFIVGACRTFEASTSQVQQLLASGLSLPPALLDSPAKRQAEFLAGRWCAREALANAGLPAHAPGRSADRAPIWPAGAVGAITHCGPLAAAVAASRTRHAGIGLDIEAIQCDDKAGALMPQVVNDVEAAMLRSLDLGSEIAFSIVFSAKETFFKTLYPLVQRSFYFSNAQCTALCTTTGTWSMELCTTLSATHTAGSVYHGYFHIREGHVLTLMTLPGESEDTCDSGTATVSIV